MRVRVRSGSRSSQAGFLLLLELLIVVLIIAALAAFFLTSGGGALGGGGANPEGGPRTMPGKAREQAESAVCRNNLQQVRAAVSTALATTGSSPADLESLQIGVPLSCPVGAEPYQYDASTGQVQCTHPGHESY
jgi:hypothetical protein